MRECGMIVDIEHPTLGTLGNAKAPGFPFKFSEVEGGYATSAPLSILIHFRIMRDIVKKWNFLS